MDEVKAAAERWSQHSECCRVPKGPMQDCPYGDGDSGELTRLMDLEILADAYLASPPRDLFDAVVSSLANALQLIDTSKLLSGTATASDAERTLARVAAWRKETQ